MTDIRQAFVTEMRRQAKREIRSAVRELQEQVVALRKAVSEQRRQILELGQGVASRTSEVVKGDAAVEEASREPESGTDVTTPTTVSEVDPKLLSQVTPHRITRLRLKLKLNQSQFARLLGVTPLSVSRWEAGLTKPRVEQKLRILRVREMGRRELKAEMQERGVIRKERRGRRPSGIIVTSDDASSTESMDE